MTDIQNRLPGKKGRKPRDFSKPALTLEHYLRPEEGRIARRMRNGILTVSDTPLPPVSGLDIDYESEVTTAGGWPMYCNGPDPQNAIVCPGSPDGCGDCTCAAPGHFFQAVNTYAGHGDLTVPARSVIDVYSSVTGYDPQTGANDNGAEMQDVLAFLKKVGMQDGAPSKLLHKVAGYAAFKDPSNLNLMAQVLDTFGTVYIGLNLPESAENQFSEGQPWSLVPGSPSAGGHAVCLQRRRNQGTGLLEYITWGAVQRVTNAFHRACCEEAWVVVTDDWVRDNGTSVQGMDLDQMLSDMSDV